MAEFDSFQNYINSIGTTFSTVPTALPSSSSDGQIKKHQPVIKYLLTKTE